ncbi:MAG: hypothetical protein ACRCW1_03265 [Anaerotignaceae bacterium]
MDFLKKYSLAVVTAIGFIITTYMLYFFQYKLYGNTIKTVWLYVLIFVPTVAIGNFLKNDEAEKPKEKKFKKLNTVITILLYIIIIWSIVSSPYNATAWNILIVPIMYLIFFIFKPLSQKLKDKNCVKERCIFVILIYMFLIAEPFVFTTITGANTVKRVQNNLIKQGYTNVQYVGNISDIRYINSLFNENVVLKNENELSLQSYIFTSENNGVEIATCVAVVSGRTLSTIKVENYSPISLYISHETTY